MSEGDRALDRQLAELMGWHDVTESHVTGELIALLPGEKRPPSGNTSRHRVVPHYTGRDWQQLATALQGEPHKFEVCLWFYPARPWAPAHCEASIWAEGKSSPAAEKSADTPGLALGRAAEQALGGES